MREEGGNHVKAGLNQINIYSLNNLLALLAYKWEEFIEYLLDNLHDLIQKVGWDHFCVVFVPCLDKWFPT